MAYTYLLVAKSNPMFISYTNAMVVKKLLLVLLTVTSEDVCRNIRNVKLKLNNFVFQHAFYYHVCNCSLCATSYHFFVLIRVSIDQFLS